MALNRVIIYGRLTKDPDVRQTQGGVSVARFTVACDRSFVDKQSGKRECDFIEVTAWRQAADFVGRYFHKGDPITVEGSLRNNNYEDKNGTKHYSYIVLADQLGFGGGAQQQPQNGNYQPAQNQAAQQAPLQAVNLADFTDIIGGNPPF